MTALVAHLRTFALRTTSNPRRILVIVIMLAAIFAAGASLLLANAPASVVTYGGAAVVTPHNTDLCPGEGLVYTQTIHVNDTGMVDISRDWCNRGGVCSLDLHQHWDSVVLTPLDFTGTVTRTVPVSPLFKPGGLYEFRSGVKNGALSVQIVPFRIRDDCE